MPTDTAGTRNLFAEDPFHNTVTDLGRNLVAATHLRQLSHRQLRQLENVDLVQDLLAASACFKGKKKGKANKGGDLEGAAFGKALRRYLRSKAGRYARPRRPGKTVSSNVALMGRLLALDKVEQDLLMFLLAMHYSEELQELVGLFGDLTVSGAARIISAAIGVPSDRVQRGLSGRGKLVSSGMVRLQSREGWTLPHLLDLRPGLLDLALAPGLDRARLVERFLPDAGLCGLLWEDFKHVDQAATTARDLLRAALDRRYRGLNILLHGPTGTGKTELSRLLAQEAGARLYTAGCEDDDGESPKAGDRLSSLLLGQRLLARDHALLLFDELEDLFQWRWEGVMGAQTKGVAQMSKQWFNNLLETCSVPTLWTTNTTDGIDPAFLRRFTFAVELGRPGTRQRARVLQRHLGEASSMSEAEVETLARRHPVSPAQLATSVRAASLLCGNGQPDLATIERIISPVQKLLGSGARDRVPAVDTDAYRLDALNSSTDLEGLAHRLSRWAPGKGAGVSICLHGPPGTGKSEFVKYLAHRADRPLHRHPASDLLSMWVGGTEQQLAAAFHDAEQDGAVLLFDEADSFLRDRRSATHSWEVTQVNEFLQQLEVFSGIVACTTNLKEALDVASLRRFVFKIELQPMRAEQARALFCAALERMGAPSTVVMEGALAEDGLATLSGLTPGDFAAVVRRFTALGDPPDAKALLAGLREELQARSMGGARPAGFFQPSPTQGQRP